jgi:hypothetical protein
MRYFAEDDLYRRPDALVQMVRATLHRPDQDRPDQGRIA